MFSSSILFANFSCAAEQGHPLPINTCTQNANPLTGNISFMPASLG